jgi:hypothetical protein
MGGFRSGASAISDATVAGCESSNAVRLRQGDLSRGVQVLSVDPL